MNMITRLSMIICHPLHSTDDHAQTGEPGRLSTRREEEQYIRLRLRMCTEARCAGVYTCATILRLKRGNNFSELRGKYATQHKTQIIVS